MANYQRARGDDVDFIPLRTPSPAQEVNNSHLPTYEEVLSDDEAQAAHQRTEQGPSWQSSQAIMDEARRDPTQFRRIVQRGKWGLVCIALAPGIGLIIGAIVTSSPRPKFN